MTYFRCFARDLPVIYPGVDCTAAGEFDQPTTGASGAAHAHTAKTGHPTMTTNDAAVGARWLEEAA